MNLPANHGFSLSLREEKGAVYPADRLSDARGRVWDAGDVTSTACCPPGTRVFRVAARRSICTQNLSFLCSFVERRVDGGVSAGVWTSSRSLQPEALLLRDRLRDRWDALVAPLELLASSTGGRVKLANVG